MRFNFNFSNDFGESANSCVRCGTDTRERCVFAFPGVRITLWACRTCLYQIAAFFWFLHEFPLRAVFAGGDAQEAGKPVAEYQNSFDFDWSGNSTPVTKNRTQKKR